MDAKYPFFIMQIEVFCPFNDLAGEYVCLTILFHKNENDAVAKKSDKSQSITMCHCNTPSFLFMVSYCTVKCVVGPLLVPTTLYFALIFPFHAT